MTKTFRKLFILCTILVLALALSACDSLSSCSFLSSNSGDEAYTYSMGTDYTEQKLKNSLTAAGSVSFAESHTTKYPEYEDVIETTNVDHAVVTVYCTYVEGATTYASVGSGVIVDVNDGVNEAGIFYVLTCQHVINDLSGKTNTVTIYVPDEDGNTYDDEGYDKDFAFTGSVGGVVLTAQKQEVSLIGGDKDSDVAVLRLYVKDSAVASKIVKAKVMSANYSLKLAEKVLAIGNPQGDHAGWVSTGVISNLKYSATVANVGDMTLVGIDVFIAPGSSGGGLFNMYGELVGITNSGDAVEVITSSGSTETVSQRLNYAIPNKTTDDSSTDNGFINIAKQLIGTYSNYNYGYVYNRKVQLGFTLAESGSTVYIAAIEGGQAYSKGLRLQDVIKSVTYKGTKTDISKLSDFSSVYKAAETGNKLTVEYSPHSGKGTNSVDLTLYQYYFCNTGTYTGIAA